MFSALLPDETLFHDLVDAVTDYAIFLLDEQGHVASWNRGAERLKGYTAAEIIGQFFGVFYPAEARAADRPRRVLEIVREQGRFAEEGWRIRKDGSKFWAGVSITPLRDANGNVRGFAKVTRDLTERRAAEEQLRRMDERFRLLVESVTDYAIYMLDAEGRVTTWNSGAERMKGYSAGEVVGKHFSLFFPLEDRPHKPERELSLALTEGRFEDEGWRVRKDGTRFWANVVLTPMRGTQHELLGFAKVTRDLTARRESEQMERRLADERAAARRAEESNRSKDEFLATVSHELRTPLNAILGWATVLKTKAAGSPLASGLDAIVRNAEAQARIVEDILDVSRIVAGKLRLASQQLDLLEVAREAVDVVALSAQAKGIELSFRHGEAAARLLGDHERLRQVVWNLLSNAIKFTKEGGAVELEVTRSDDGGLKLVVRDTGRGIEPDFLPYVFDRFRQADSASTRRHGGLGLGLSLVRHIVELHGGRVYVESEGRDRGATFSVYLPVRALATAAEALPPTQTFGARRSERSRLDGVQLLVVDDDQDAREILAELLSDDGAIVTASGSVSEALEAFQRIKPQLVISDIAMPGEDGYSLARRIRALEADAPAQTPLVALSAFTRPQDRAKAIQAGFTAHVSKPVIVTELTRLIATLV